MEATAAKETKAMEGNTNQSQSLGNKRKVRSRAFKKQTSSQWEEGLFLERNYFFLLEYSEI